MREAPAAGSEPEIDEEMGDILFSCVNLARRLGLDAEASLAACKRRSSNGDSWPWRGRRQPPAPPSKVSRRRNLTRVGGGKEG